VDTTVVGAGPEPWTGPWWFTLVLALAIGVRLALVAAQYRRRRREDRETS
jgi:hypothetical protein